MTFKELGIIDPILKAVEEQGYEKPTPIQEGSIPILLKKTDLLGVAQTGTGKTAAFSIPIIQHIAADISKGGRKVIKALIVTPTRELAIQIDDNIKTYSKYTSVRHTVIFGGVKQGSQVNRLKSGIDILTATPGRLLDLMNQKIVSLSDIEYFVLDEADQMLDMGFINDIKKLIAKLPKQRQSLFFSATMPNSIVELSKTILGKYESITIKPQQATAERVEQSLYHVHKQDKVSLLIHIIKERNPASVLIFSRTKHGADKIVKKLDRSDIKAAAIHGNKSQNNRQKALGLFKDGKISVLVATDIAARGIDVAELELVINFDLPNVPETYVHRIGRTGRASASGEAISFCMSDEKSQLKDIQKLIKSEIPVVKDHPFLDDGRERPVVEKSTPNHNKPHKPRRNNPKNHKNSVKEHARKDENSGNNEESPRDSKPRSNKNSNRKKRPQNAINSNRSEQKNSENKSQDKPFPDSKSKGNSDNRPPKKKSGPKPTNNNNKAKSIPSPRKPKRDYLKLLE